MDKHLFIELLQKYRLGKATEEECQFLLSYYQLFEQEPEVQAFMTTEKQLSLKKEINSQIWENINFQDTLSHKHSVRKLWIRRLSIAAILMVLISTGLYFLNVSPSRQGKVIAQVQPAKPHEFIRLPDGSMVILSSGSKFKSPASFEGVNQREVYLEGEAYFDVKHNASKPFLIHTGKVTTTVLGTAFEVKAWPHEADITVTVTRGKVKVDEDKRLLGFITPNEQIIYNKAEGSSIHNVLTASFQPIWKQQDLIIDDATVAEATQLLEDRFRVKITISSEQIKNKRFTTTFLKDESLDKILKSLCEFNGAVYQYDKENASVVISSE